MPPAVLIQLVLLLLVPIFGCWCALATGKVPRSAAIIKTYENDTVLLPCHVEDLGVEPRVRWWKKMVDENGTAVNKPLADSGEPSTAAASHRIKMWGNRSLELILVRPEDSGKYVCQAQRPEPWGHVTQVHEIQVIYPPSVKTIPEDGLLEVKLGEEAEMSCEATGTPKPVLAWNFQGQELPVLSAGKRLRIHATNRSLAGVYTCEAKNGIGEPARGNIELKIKHKPEVSAVSRWVHSAPGIRTKLHCLVVSWPEAQLEWLFEGKPVGRSAHLLRHKQDEPSSSSGASSAQLHSLVVRSLKPEDLGVYTCRASNELGEAEASLELSGAAKPPLLKKASRTSSSSTSYNFIWEVDSYSPIIEYQFWFRQMRSDGDWRRLTIPSANEPTGPLHALSFNLTGLQPSKQYEALVLARNHFGWSSPSNIVRFASVSMADKNEETYDADNDGIEKVPAAVQVTSDSHRSSADADSSGSLERNCLALLLPLLLVFVGCCYNLPTLTLS